MNLLRCPMLAIIRRTGMGTNNINHQRSLASGSSSFLTHPSDAHGQDVDCSESSRFAKVARIPDEDGLSLPIFEREESLVSHGQRVTQEQGEPNIHPPHIRERKPIRGLDACSLRFKILSYSHENGDQEHHIGMSWVFEPREGKTHVKHSAAK